MANQTNGNPWADEETEALVNFRVTKYSGRLETTASVTILFMAKFQRLCRRWGLHEALSNAAAR